MRTVATETDRRIRMRELAMQEEQDEKELEEARKNRGFTQVYPLGWKQVRELAKSNSGAAMLYTFFAEHIDPSCGAVVVSQTFLAEEFNVTPRTVIRWLNYLEEKKVMVKIPIAGRVCAYALNPNEVWKGYDTTKNYAAFMTKTLVNQDEDIRRRLMSMFKEREPVSGAPESSQEGN